MKPPIRAPRMPTAVVPMAVGLGSPRDDRPSDRAREQAQQVQPRIPHELARRALLACGVIPDVPGQIQRRRHLR